MPSHISDQEAPQRRCKYAGCTNGPRRGRKAFTPRKPWQEFCCSACRYAFHHHGPAYGELSKFAAKKLAADAAAQLRRSFPRIAEAMLREPLRALDSRIAALEREMEAARRSAA